ncbi:hypothetical protein F4782DRAFT_371620 [Xylaria castorea]|nr:hypothetical protein F4782DRAFT_371620 [Xylaria castorea]
MMMSVTSAAARRLLRTLSLSQPTVMTDLQRDGRDGPAADGRSWCAAVDDGAGTDSSSTCSCSCFELELWPSQSANSRPLPPDSFPYSSSSILILPPADDRQDNHLRNDRSYSSSELGGETSKLKNAARLCIDTPSSDEYTLGNPKTILSPQTSHIRLLPRADSSDSISSSTSTLVPGASCTGDKSEGLRNRISAATTGVPPIVAWGEKVATRRQRTRSNARETSAEKKESGDEADELFWRGYWD